MWASPLRTPTTARPKLPWITVRREASDGAKPATSKEGARPASPTEPALRGNPALPDSHRRGDISGRA